MAVQRKKGLVRTAKKGGCLAAESGTVTKPTCKKAK